MIAIYAEHAVDTDIIILGIVETSQEARQLCQAYEANPVVNYTGESPPIRREWTWHLDWIEVQKDVTLQDVYRRLVTL